MRDPTLASFTSQLGVAEDSQDSAAESEDRQFKKPPLPSAAIAKLQQENEKLRDQLLQIMHEHQAEAGRQREEQRENRISTERQLAQQKEQMERQLAQQKEESRVQKEMMEKQISQQGEIIRLLKGNDKVT